jgi:hypothetical protein
MAAQFRSRKTMSLWRSNPNESKNRLSQMHKGEGGFTAHSQAASPRDISTASVQKKVGGE